ncbi:MAG: hypothetical protein ACK4LA_01310 [Aquificaceae bacterium]
MKGLKDLLINDWQYKLLALLLGISLWLTLNLGARVPVRLERHIDVFNKEEGYTYRLESKRAIVRLQVMERFVPEEALEKIQVGVDVKGFKEGEYTLKVEVRNITRFIISVEKIEPEYVRVKVIKAPKGGS